MVNCLFNNFNNPILSVKFDTVYCCLILKKSANPRGSRFFLFYLEKNYLNIEKNIRLEFISNENRNYIPNYYINCIINTLDEYEKNKDLSYLESNLDNMISRYFKE